MDTDQASDPPVVKSVLLKCLVISLPNTITFSTSTRKVALRFAFLGLVKSD